MSNRRTSRERRRRRDCLHRAQDGACFWCDLPVAREAATLDELIPRSRGGTDRWGNIVMSCKPCNRRRGNATAPQWAIEIAEQLRRIVHSPAIRRLTRSAAAIEASA